MKTTVATVPLPSLAQLLHKSAEGAATPMNFDCSPEDMGAIGAIVKRLIDIGKHQKPPVIFDQMMWAVDVANVHCNGFALNLTQLLMSAHADFMHDVVGIAANCDRVRGGIRGEWRPIFLRGLVP